MNQGRGGMGSHKHSTSGYAPRSPRYKMMQTMEANRQAETDAQKRPKSVTYTSIAEALNAYKNRMNRTP